MNKQASWVKVIWRKNLPGDDETNSRGGADKGPKRKLVKIYTCIYLYIFEYTRHHMKCQRV